MRRDYKGFRRIFGSPQEAVRDILVFLTVFQHLPSLKRAQQRSCSLGWAMWRISSALAGRRRRLEGRRLCLAALWVRSRKTSEGRAGRLL